MIHYHGTPITPLIAAHDVLRARHAMVSFAHPDQIGLVLEVCQTVALDNGAFSAWRAGNPVEDWGPFYGWCANLLRLPPVDWAIIPDVIDGDEDDNDALIADWPFERWRGVPVWHLHESLERLDRLSREWPRIALGSSGLFAQIGTTAWWNRMDEAMEVVCDGGVPRAKLHGLRMLDPDIVRRFPFASCDSTNVAQNIGKDCRWHGPYEPATKADRAIVIAGRIETAVSPLRYEPSEQAAFELELA